jgi:hypothetical protein
MYVCIYIYHSEFTYIIVVLLGTPRNWWFKKCKLGTNPSPSSGHLEGQEEGCCLGPTQHKRVNATNTNGKFVLFEKRGIYLWNYFYRLFPSYKPLYIYTPPFTRVFPLPSIYKGFPVATFDYQRWNSKKVKASWALMHLVEPLVSELEHNARWFPYCGSGMGIWVNSRR